MVDLKPITDAILADAKIRAEKIMEDARAAADAVKTETQKEKEYMRRDFENRLSGEIDRIYSAENAQIRDRERTTLLKVKAEAVKKAAEISAERICGLDDSQYLEFIKGLLKSAEIEKDSVVFLNERDKKRLDKKMFAPARVSDECIDTKGGFKVSGKDADFDLTIEAVSEEKFDEISHQIGRIYEKGEP